MFCLADTNILSELVRPRPNPGVMSWAGGVSRIAVSVITLEEIGFGLAKTPHPKVRAALDAFLEAHCEALPITSAIARHAGDLRGRLAATGKPRTQADLLIAATAQQHGLTLVTRNVRDFEGCAVALLDPFE